MSGATTTPFGHPHCQISLLQQVGFGTHTAPSSQMEWPPIEDWDGASRPPEHQESAVDNIGLPARLFMITNYANAILRVAMTLSAGGRVVRDLFARAPAPILISLQRSFLRHSHTRTLTRNHNITISSERVGSGWAGGVCDLVFLSRYMRPEGPWQRLRRCLSQRR